MKVIKVYELKETYGEPCWMVVYKGGGFNAYYKRIHQTIDEVIDRAENDNDVLDVESFTLSSWYSIIKDCIEGRRENLLVWPESISRTETGSDCKCRKIDLIGKGHDFDCPYYKPPNLTKYL